MEQALDGDKAASTDESSNQEELYYFTYGPVCNELVRKRRGIVASHIQAAYLPEYRLTFALGGMVNIVPRRGYEVHGLLMKLATPEDWDRVVKFDAGWAPSRHTVIPYDADGKERDAVDARLVEVSHDVEDDLLDSPIEVLPECRYLELIAEGMRAHHVDDDYIQDQIMAVPFIPKKLPDEYQKCPLDTTLLSSSSSFLKSKTESKSGLPLLSFKKYLKLCDKQPAVGGDIYIIIDDGVFRIQKPSDIDKVPAAKWLLVNGHGKPDCSLMIHQAMVDLSIPLCDEMNQLTPLHFAWAENQIVEVLMHKHQCPCSKVAMLKPESDDDKSGSSSSSSVFIQSVMRTSKRFSMSKK